MTKETSLYAAEFAAKGMTKPLTRAEQKIVCASCLSQVETAPNPRKVRAALRGVKKVLISPEQANAVDRLEALLFPAKEPA